MIMLYTSYTLKNVSIYVLRMALYMYIDVYICIPACLHVFN